MGLSQFFRSPCIPLGISVENHVLEIAGLDSGSGFVLGLEHLQNGKIMIEDLEETGRDV